MNEGWAALFLLVIALLLIELVLRIVRKDWASDTALIAALLGFVASVVIAALGLGMFLSWFF